MNIYQSRTTEDTGSFKNINYHSKINDNLREKYTTTTEFYNAKVVHDIMYNESVQIVSIFKDYLILDDLTEFFKRPYSMEEAHQKLPRMIKFYDSYSKAIPNYAVLPENQHLFKNIAKKQKAAEEKHRYLMYQKTQKKPTEEEHARMMNSIMSEEKLFDPKFIEEVKLQKYLPDRKDYKKMKLSRILDSFLQNSSIMLSKSLHSTFKDTNASIFSRISESINMIPPEALEWLKKKPEFWFTADVLNQRAKNKLITDHDTGKAIAFRITRALFAQKRKEVAKQKEEEKKEAKRKINDKKIILKSTKEKFSNKASKRISIDDRNRFIKTISKIKTRNTALKQ